MIEEKDDIKQKLKQLKKIGITRVDVATKFYITPGYLNQMVGKSGKVPPGFINGFNQFFEDSMKPATLTRTVTTRTKKAKTDPRNTLYIQRKEDSAFTDYARRMEAATDFHEMEGDAMHPLIKRGDGLLLVEIDKEVIIGGEVYVIELDNGLTVVRYIKFEESDPKKLMLVAYNRAAGDTANLYRHNISRLFKIVLKISK